MGSTVSARNATWNDTAEVVTGRSLSPAMPTSSITERPIKSFSSFSQPHLPSIKVPRASHHRSSVSDAVISLSGSSQQTESILVPSRIKNDVSPRSGATSHTGPCGETDTVLITPSNNCGAGEEEHDELAVRVQMAQQQQQELHSPSLPQPPQLMPPPPAPPQPQPQQGMPSAPQPVPNEENKEAAAMVSSVHDSSAALHLTNEASKRKDEPPQGNNDDDDVSSFGEDSWSFTDDNQSPIISLGLGLFSLSSPGAHGRGADSAQRRIGFGFNTNNNNSNNNNSTTRGSLSSVDRGGDAAADSYQKRHRRSSYGNPDSVGKKAALPMNSSTGEPLPIGNLRPQKAESFSSHSIRASVSFLSGTPNSALRGIAAETNPAQLRHTPRRAYPASSDPPMPMKHVLSASPFRPADDPNVAATLRLPACANSAPRAFSLTRASYDNATSTSNNHPVLHAQSSGPPPVLTHAWTLPPRGGGGAGGITTNPCITDGNGNSLSASTPAPTPVLPAAPLMPAHVPVRLSILHASADTVTVENNDEGVRIDRNQTVSGANAADHSPSPRGAIQAGDHNNNSNHHNNLDFGEGDERLAENEARGKATARRLSPLSLSNEKKPSSPQALKSEMQLPLSTECRTPTKPCRPKSLAQVRRDQMACNISNHNKKH